MKFTNTPHFKEDASASMQIRLHRGGFAESMSTGTVIPKTKAALVDFINKAAFLMPCWFFVKLIEEVSQIFHHLSSGDSHSAVRKKLILRSLKMKMSVRHQKVFCMQHSRRLYPVLYI